MKFRVVSFLAYWIARLLALTMRMRVVGEEHFDAVRNAGCGCILVTWHGRTLVPLSRFRGRGYWALISTSRDGEYQNQIYRRFGFHTVRGSTSARGAIRSALALTKQLKAGEVLAFTPDGPRGPSGRVQPGALFFAQKSGCPIIPAGTSAQPRVFCRDWSHFLLPVPFARAALIYGEPIYIPAEARTDDELQLWAERVESAIDALEDQAEQMVGARKKPEGALNEWRRV